MTNQKVTDDTKFAIVDLLKTTELNHREIALKVGVSSTFVTKLNRKLSIRATPRRKPWTQKELWFLKENYSKLTIKQLASKLERSEMSVKERSRKLGLKKRKVKETPTPTKKGKIPVRQRHVIAIDISNIISKPLPK
ncbi:hypothetical protein [Streptococcus thoraltensis]|uniref:hypothetical protein n=1 Tax=Streptococcus thoraltensis TaxID=55085 RepID=UPI001F57E87D|nr:hypothetical protein [Streptococcus thoraltensis]